MPPLVLLPFTGLRVREEELRELGMSLPGLRRRAEAVARLPALGLLTIAGLTPSSWSVSLHEAPGDQEALLERVLEERPDLAAISALTASIEEAYGFAARLRRAGVRVVIGGLHASACPEEAMAHAGAVVAGEGEPVWPDVLRDAEAGALKPLYRAPRPFDLSRAPLPRFDLLGRGCRPRLTLQTQRGCPLACEFCGASRLLGPFREKPVSILRAELEALAAIMPRPRIELADDNTFAGPRPVLPLLEAFASAGARWFTEADWRIGERPELLRALADSGCIEVLVGFESPLYEHRGMGAKAAAWSRILEAVEAIQEAGVAVAGCFIAGVDGETEESLERLGERLLESPLAEVQLTLETPFPGTALRRRLERQGRLIPERGWSHHTLFDVAHRPQPLSPEALEAAFRRLLRQVFSSAAEARREAIRSRIRRHRGRD